MKRVICIIVVICMSVVLTSASFAEGDLKAGSKRIALTFDDGPHPRYTPEILEVLAEYDITATFFVIGVNVENYHDSYLKMIESGCEVGNHTYSHANLNFADTDKIRNEIEQCARTMADGEGSRLLRPPGGACNTEVKRVAGALDYHLVFWTIDTLDWANTGTKQIVDSVLNNAGDGDIVLMHDYVSGKSHAAEALRIIIPTLKSRGFKFVTVSELQQGK